MARRSRLVSNLLSLAFVLAVAVGVWSYRQPLGKMYRQALAEFVPCATPIGYHLDQFDDRFDISRAEFMSTVQEAADTWSQAAGKTLFEPRPDGDLEINLIYDYRQEATDQLKKMGLSIDSHKETYDDLKAEYDTRKARVESLRADYQEDYAAWEARLGRYNQEIASWNERGGAPPPVYARLQQEKQDLEAEEKWLREQNAKLNEEVEDLNAVVTVLNRIAANLDLEAEQFNRTASARGEKFQEGEYQRQGGETEINIYEFEDEEMLKRVLMHEFGHAIGLGHLPDSDAVMYELNTGQAAQLSEADRQAIQSHCRFAWPWQ